MTGRGAAGLAPREEYTKQLIAAIPGHTLAAA